MEYSTKKWIAVPACCFSCEAKIYAIGTSRCPAFFPAEVVKNGHTIHLCYHTEGYLPLSRYSCLDHTRVLTAVKGLLHQIDTARDWLWFPEEYVISVHTVWMNSRGEIRILCIPEASTVPFHRRMQSFLHNLKRLSEPTVSSCLDALDEIIQNGTVRTGYLLSEIDQMEAELLSYF